MTFNEIKSTLIASVAPDDPHSDTAQRSNLPAIRLLTWMLVVLNATSILTTLWIADFRPAVPFLLIGGIIALLSAVLMSTRYYRSGLMLGIVGVIVVMVGMIWSRTIAQNLVVAIFPVLYISIRMNLRLTLLIIAFVMGNLIAVLPYLQSSVGETLLSGGMVVAASVVIALQTRIMEQSRYDLEKQKARVRESDSRYSSAIEGSLDAFYLVKVVKDASGAVSDFIITDTNTRGEQLGGQPRQNLIGQSLHAIFPSLLQQFPTQPAPAAPEQSVAYEYQFENCPIFNVQVVPFSDYLALTVTDITDRKMADQVRREIERLNVELVNEREMNLLRSNLMSTISHEFRTPLTVIMNNSEILDRYYQRLTEKQRGERILTIKDHVLQLRAMLENISLIVRGASNRLPFQPEEADLGLYLRSLFDQTQELDNQLHRMTFTTEGNLRETAVDLTLVHQIVSNLLLNALKFTPADGNVSFSVAASETTVIMRVEDSGIGIPEADLARIYEPFHRALNIGEVRGTGLGLSIVRECTLRHGGTIDVVSQVGQGTTFTVCLPRRSAPVDVPIPENP